MAYVVAEPCGDCKDTGCVAVCPADCFHDGERMLYINPAQCIDCGACASECPVKAIYHEDYLPPELRPYRDLNATLSQQSPAVARKRLLFRERCTGTAGAQHSPGDRPDALRSAGARIEGEIGWRSR